MQVTVLSPSKLRFSSTETPSSLPSAYRLAGGAGARVLEVESVSGDPLSVDLRLDTLLAPAGTLTLLYGSQSVQFSVPTFETPGSLNQHPADLIQLPRGMRGVMVQALKEALGSGDVYVNELGRDAHDQISFVTAEGRYLDTRGKDLATPRPDFGMGDREFRSILTAIKNGRSVRQNLWKVLEAYYGSERTRSHVVALAPPPYNISPGDQLQLEVDGVPYTVDFSSSDFLADGAATANEVASAIARRLAEQGSQATADLQLNSSDLTFRPRIMSGTVGIDGSVKLLGGTAMAALQFPALVLALLQGCLVSVQRNADGTATYSLDDLTSAPLLFVNAGDRFAIYDAAIHADNRLAAEVISTRCVWNGSSYTQSWTVANPYAVNQSEIPLVTAKSAFFWRDHTATFRTVNSAGVVTVLGEQVVVQIGGLMAEVPGGLRFQLPSTASSITRNAETGAYFEDVAAPKAATGDTSTAGLDLTSVAHGMAAGDQFEIRWTSEHIKPTFEERNNGAIVGPLNSNADVGTSLGGARTYAAAISLVGIASPPNQLAPALLVGGANASSKLATSRLMEVKPDSSGFLETNVGARAVAASHIALAPMRGRSRVAVAFGGMTGSGVTDSLDFYDPDNQTWTNSPTPLHTAAQNTLAVPAYDTFGLNDHIVLLVGGDDDTDANDAVTAIASDGSGGVEAIGTAALPYALTRARGAAILGEDYREWIIDGNSNPYDTILDDELVRAASSDRVLIPGGALLVGSVTTPTDKAFEVFQNSGAPVCQTVGRLAVARYNHAVVALGNDQVAIIGGFGRNLSNETADRVVREIEIYDARNRRFFGAGKLRYGRMWDGFHHGCYLEADPVSQEPLRLVVSGGTDASYVSIPYTEVLDLRTGRWTSYLEHVTATERRGAAYVAVGAISGGTPDPETAPEFVTPRLSETFEFAGGWSGTLDPGLIFPTLDFTTPSFTETFETSGGWSGT